MMTFKQGRSLDLGKLDSHSHPESIYKESSRPYDKIDMDSYCLDFMFK
jgi:hypothetical protein